jgi:hypothetical protein
MGETCGSKLVSETIHEPGKCNMCLAIEKKERRYAKAMQDYARWKDDRTRQASAEKAAEDARTLYEEIIKLKTEKDAKSRDLGGSRRRNGQNSAYNNLPN